MKTLLPVVLLFTMLATAGAQQGIELQLSNGPGQLSATRTLLQFTGGTLVSASENGQFPFIAGGVGLVTFTTPDLARGVVANGGSFGPGGSIYVSSPYGVALDATFVSGNWRRTVLSDGTNLYVLTAQLKGTMWVNWTTYNCEGIIVQASANTGKALFGGNRYSGGGTFDVIAIP